LESQLLRFSKLTSIISNNDEHISINDYGCGYGAHLDFLINNAGLKVNRYNGYDLSIEMLEAAKEKLSIHQAEIQLKHSSSLETVADYSFVSGTFNVRFEASDKDWEEFIKAKLHEMHRFSNKGFSFNLLTSYVDWKEPHLYYGDPCYWFDYCKKHFSKKVSLLHDYPLWEWTILVKAT
jgi:SAM-dependent methyltransferase